MVCKTIHKRIQTISLGLKVVDLFIIGINLQKPVKKRIVQIFINRFFTPKKTTVDLTESQNNTVIKY